jgi:hypothetical protein
MSILANLEVISAKQNITRVPRLLSRSLVSARNTPFYAHWVSKFLAFSNRNQDLGSNLRVQKFLNQ